MNRILAVLVSIIVLCVTTIQAQTSNVSISTDTYEFKMLISDIDRATKNLLDENMKKIVLKKFEKRAPNNKIGLVRSAWFLAAVSDALFQIKWASTETGADPLVIMNVLKERYEREVAVARAVALICKDSFIEEKSNEFLVTQETALMLIQWTKLEYELSLNPPSKKTPVKAYWEDEINSA
ncbi:MAG: hypothetical protein ACYC3G_04245 [Minisyncoccota bacterium]